MTIDLGNFLPTSAQIENMNSKASDVRKSNIAVAYRLQFLKLEHNIQFNILLIALAARK